jgi:phage gp46-like protein
LEDAMEQIRRNTRKYARRQLTWFRHQLPSEAVRIDAMRPLEEQVEAVLAAMRGAGLRTPGERKGSTEGSLERGTGGKP